MCPSPCTFTHILRFALNCDIRILALQRDKFRHLYTEGQEVHGSLQLFEDLMKTLDVEREAKSMHGIHCCTYDTFTFIVRERTD